VVTLGYRGELRWSVVVNPCGPWLMVSRLREWWAWYSGAGNSYPDTIKHGWHKY